MFRKLDNFIDKLLNKRLLYYIAKAIIYLAIIFVIVLIILSIREFVLYFSAKIPFDVDETKIKIAKAIKAAHLRDALLYLLYSISSFASAIISSSIFMFLYGHLYHQSKILEELKYYNTRNEK